MRINRRTAMAGIAGATLTASRATTPAALDLSDPQAKLDAFVRMRCQPAGARGYMWYAGTFFGKLHGEAAVPLLGISGFSWNRALRQPDGSYLYELQEAGYHTDLATGARLDRWQNPLNGLTVEPRHYRSGQKTRFTPERVMPARPLPDGIDFNGTISPARVLHDSVWISEDLLVRSPNPRERYANPLEYCGPYRTSTSLATLQSPLAAVLDPDLDFTPCSLSYVTVNSWRSWMLMGQAPGTITWRLMGRKLRSPDQLGEPLRTWLSDEHPDLLAGG